MDILKKIVFAVAATFLAVATPAIAANPTVPPHIQVTNVAEAQGTVPELKIANASYPVGYESYSISNDWGGSILEYVEKYTTWRLQGAKVRVEGFCVSACAMMTGLLEDKNVCVSPFSIFAFHSAGFGPFYAYSEPGTRLLWQVYPEHVRKLLAANGWSHPSEHPDLLYIKGTDLYKQCED